MNICIFSRVSEYNNIACQTPISRCDYCKFGNFRENFIFANSVKTHICDVKKLQKWRDLPISVNERVISPIREGFIFYETSHMRSFAKIKPSQNFQIYSTIACITSLNKSMHCVVADAASILIYGGIYEP